MQGVKSNPLPYCRGQWTGYHDTELFLKEPYVKEEVEKSWCRPGPTKPPRAMTSLQTDAIGKPTVKLRGNRHSDPVQPVYELPAFTPVPPLELKFIRDNIECKDITMDSRRKLFVNPRESTSLIREDIQGTSSKQLHKERKGLYSAGAGVPPQPLDQLYVTDIA